MSEQKTKTQKDGNQAVGLKEVGHCTAVLSGKGGVGKSTVAVNLAATLADQGFRVGLMDVDIHGPSVPTMLGLGDARMSQTEEGMTPVLYRGIKVASIGFMLRSNDEPIIWRGPLKNTLIKKFIEDVDWGTLDHLVIDCPPGTGDEPLSVCQMLDERASAVIVTTPQEVAAADVRRCITFCRELDMPIAGLVENMSGFCCSECGKVTHIFARGGGEALCGEFEIPFLGCIPLDPGICAGADRGLPVGTAPVEARIRDRFVEIATAVAGKAPSQETTSTDELSPENVERFAIPLAEGVLCNHFGHCESFALLDVSAEGGSVERREDVIPPPHEPGVLPKWLAGQGVRTVIAGGMGSRAQALFSEAGITVVTGAPAAAPETLVADHLAGTMVPGVNACDH